MEEKERHRGKSVRKRIIAVRRERNRVIENGVIIERKRERRMQDKNLQQSQEEKVKSGKEKVVKLVKEMLTEGRS